MARKLRIQYPGAIYDVMKFTIEANSAPARSPARSLLKP
jgi:hypothetical protein